MQNWFKKIYRYGRRGLDVFPTQTSIWQSRSVLIGHCEVFVGKVHRFTGKNRENFGGRVNSVWSRLNGSVLPVLTVLRCPFFLIRFDI
jgi:hypothetical protein